jgi:hypothetical protein
MKAINLIFITIIVFLCSKISAKHLLKTTQLCITPGSETTKADSVGTLTNGSGEISFDGKGNGAYIRILNNNSNFSHEYWIIIAGWDNNITKILRGDGSSVCEIPQSLDLNKIYQYRLVLNPSASRIRLLLDNVEAWTCIDENGWLNPEAKYFSISQYSNPIMMFCNITSKALSEPVNNCFIPDPSLYTLNSQWTLTEGSGSLIFNGYGNELYIRLINPNSDSYQYWIILDLNGNQTKITRGDGSLVCLIEQPINLNVISNYNMVFDKAVSSITLFVNNIYAWSCTDPNGWNAVEAKWIGISKSVNYFYQMCDVQSVKLADNKSYTQLNMTKTAR